MTEPTDDDVERLRHHDVQLIGRRALERGARERHREQLRHVYSDSLRGLHLVPARGLGTVQGAIRRRHQFLGGPAVNRKHG